MTDDGGGAATGSGKGTSVSDFLFNVTNCGTLWDLINWENVTGVDISYEKIIRITVERYVEGVPFKPQ